MPAAQQLLFPDPQPLVERLGRDFFRELPECPGVYLMRDMSDVILYVGKARNLRKRLGSYRVANPDRMPRRHLRLLRIVARIELQECPDESTALARESELLRTVRPRFNRAGTWPAPPRFFAWRCVEQQLQLAVAERPDAHWRLQGPLGGTAFVLRAVLARLLWFRSIRAPVSPGCQLVGFTENWIPKSPFTAVPRSSQWHSTWRDSCPVKRQSSANGFGANCPMIFITSRRLRLKRIWNSSRMDLPL